VTSITAALVPTARNPGSSASTTPNSASISTHSPISSRYRASKTWRGARSPGTRTKSSGNSPISLTHPAYPRRLGRNPVARPSSAPRHRQRRVAPPLLPGRVVEGGVLDPRQPEREQHGRGGDADAAVRDRPDPRFDPHRGEQFPELAG